MLTTWFVRSFNLMCSRSEYVVRSCIIIVLFDFVKLIKFYNQVSAKGKVFSIGKQ